MPPSIEQLPTFAPLAEGGFPLGKIDDAALAGMLGIRLPEVAARRQALEQRLADPAAVEALVLALPLDSVAILALLAGAGGVMWIDDLEAKARERYRMAPEAVTRATAGAIRAALVAPLRSRPGPGEGEPLCGLVAPAAALIARLVTDLDLPVLPDAPFVARDDHRARLLVGAAMSLAHANVKVTQGNRPNMTHTKRLAATVGLDVLLLERLLLAAMETGLIARGHGDDVEHLRPQREALEQAAEGRYAADPAVAAILELLTAGPVPFEVARRVGARLVFGPRMPARFDATEPELLALLPGIAVGTVGDVLAIAMADLGGAPAGHVTPSFEVYLPPESPPRDIVRVGRFAQVSRLDRMLTFRVTRDSVARAAAAGDSAEEILAVLGAVGRHPVPQNVEVAIRDWAGGTQATIELCRVVTVDAASSDRVEAALRPLEARRVAPGVFLVPSGVPLRQVTLALAQAGAQVRDAAPPTPSARTSRAEAASAYAHEARQPIVGQPPVALRRSFTRWLERQLEHPRPRPAPRPAPVEPNLMLSGITDDGPSAPEEIHAALREARASGEVVAVELRGGRSTRLRVLDVTQRGRTWMVLGEELDSGLSVAHPIDQIRTIRVASDGPWVPGPGAPAPAGHVACPCGSGARYRNCCRRAAPPA